MSRESLAVGVVIEIIAVVTAVVGDVSLLQEFLLLLRGLWHWGGFPSIFSLESSSECFHYEEGYMVL